MGPINRKFKTKKPSVMAGKYEWESMQVFGFAVC